MVLRDWFWTTSWLAPKCTFLRDGKFPKNFKSQELRGRKWVSRKAGNRSDEGSWLIVLFYQWCDQASSVTMKLKAPENQTSGAVLFGAISVCSNCSNKMPWRGSVPNADPSSRSGESLFVGGPLHLYMERGISFMKVSFLHSIITSQILVY